MRALRVVGITGEDGDTTVVLEDPERRERFSVPADETLRAAARGDLARLGQIAIEVGSELRPREIQARIRAGASVTELAAAAGVSEQKIERFAYPVLLERSRTAELARLAHPVRADGPDARTLAEVVDDTFGLRGQEYDAAVWDSWKGEDGRWVITLSWTAGRSDNSAHWTFQPGASGGTVTALDDNAGDLVEGLLARPLRPLGPVIDIGRDDEAAAEQPRRAEVARAAGQRIEHRRSEPATDQRRPDAPRTDPRRPAAPRVEPPRAEPSRAEPNRPEPRTAPSRDETPAPAATATPTRPDEPLPAAAEPAAGDGTAASDEGPGTPATAARRTKKGKPVMPSWDEVLLGVKGQR